MGFPSISSGGLRHRVVWLAIAFCAGSSSALWAQNTSSSNDSANQSWTSAADSHNANVDPMRTVESHTQSGNRTVDKQSVQRRAPDGSYQPYQDIEKETVDMGGGTVRTITRTFDHNANGGATLVQVVEEEKHGLGGGDSRVVRSTSSPDVNGKLQLQRRQIEETKKISSNVEETKTTLMLPSVNGGLVPSAKVDERRERGANGTIESQKTTLLPDGAGNWQVNEVRKATITPEGESRSTEERVSVPDSEGKLRQVSRTVSKAADLEGGEKRDSVDTFSVDVAGAVPDGGLHQVERAITVQHTGLNGQQVTEQQVEKPNPGDPGAGLRVTTVTVDTVRPGASGAQATRTVQARDLNGNLGVVSFDTARSDNIHAIQVQIAPASDPKPEPKANAGAGKNPR
jgi:hypothetical protein